MNLSVLQKATKADLNMDPFPHVVIENALPEPIYKQLLDEFPEQAVIDRGGLFDGHTHRLLAPDVINAKDVPGIWEEFFKFHVSQQCYREAIELLEPALASFYPEKLDAIRKARTAVRNVRNSDIELDCQFVLNRPNEDTSRTTHLDNPRELYAMLLYVRPPEDTANGGDLQIYRTRHDHVGMTGVREANPDDLEWVKDVTYAANKLVLFLNTPKSFHGVSVREPGNCNRRSINIIAELPKKKSWFGNKKAEWYRI